MEAPIAVASSWWPRQIPNTGTSPTSAPIAAVAYGTVAGSPGPLERKTPSGRRASTSAAGVDAGTTSTVAMRDRWRRIVVLIPKS